MTAAQHSARQEEILAEIRRAADEAFDRNPGRPLSAAAARRMARLLRFEPEAEAAA